MLRLEQSAARFVFAVTFRLAVEAEGGASSTDLLAAVDVVMALWPPAPSRQSLES